MSEHAFAMPAVWEDTGKPRSAGPFLWAYLVPSGRTATPPRKRGPRAQPKTITLPGTLALDAAGRRTVSMAPNERGMSVSRAVPSVFRENKNEETI
jgi:hypothetical protein